MSFILDALKKSEAERQRQNVPGLMDMGPARTRPRFPVWGIWIGALLGVNLIVLLVVLTRTGTAPVSVAPTAASPAASPAAPAVPGASAAAAQQFSPMEPVGPPVYAPEIPVAQAAAPPVGSVAADVARAPAPQYVKPMSPAQAFGPQLRVSPPPAEKDEVLPTLAEINMSGNRGIPELHLDIHVFAAKPAERFVFINNQKYKEGGTLAEGPSVERITREGVVLNYQTLRFFLPRQ